MNSYYKFAPNVFVAKCDSQHQKGDVISVCSKHGTERDHIVFNFLGSSVNGQFHYYSIVRLDGYNAQEHAKAKAAKFDDWATKAAIKSDACVSAAMEGHEFLSLGEPIKVGHHSEKRHRALIARNHARMDKSIEFQNKADSHASKAAYWASRMDVINLSMPESLEYYEHLLEVAQDKHAGIKSGKYPKHHSYSLQYAKKEVNECKKKLELAVKLWGEQEE